ncbi:MAG: prolipoprotein diacylglyceryl transferase, partial [Deltaproteobacteria bacterium]|nr:prolipoprotein diacylglyceryl transferase [Deltaproteobacteria bacterium]
MLHYPTINPTIIKIGPLQIRWYGVMYILAFLASYFLVKYQIRKKRLTIDINTVNDLYLFLIIGLIIGARLGYVVFYNLPFYLSHPLELFAIWEGGMSFHGGLIGIILSGLIFVKKHKASFWEFADLISVTAPIGLGLGRLGNFINAELYGRVTNLPWGMIFPSGGVLPRHPSQLNLPWGMIFPSGGVLPRHPSQLYELFLEGILLFMVLWWIKDFHFKKGTLFCLFLILYSIFRFFIEFFREPDPQLGLIFSFITMGQALSIFMCVSGLVLLC